MAVSRRDMRSNPCFEVRKFKGEARRKRYLLPDEETRLMQALVGRRAYLRLIVVIALQTGMRRGEILRLRKQDIDFYRGEIHVTKTKTDNDREVPMTPTLERELKRHCETLGSDFLFANQKTRMPITEFKHGFDSACEQAGIRDFWFHDIRHTAATRMAESGVDPFTIAAIMGHTDIKMTASYTHATTSARRAAVAALEQASFGSGPQMAHKTDQRPLLTAAG
ncbi:MAG: site-specific integrase [Blastocatellia bacterium]